MTTKRDWRELVALQQEAGYHGCIGLDTVIEKIPDDVCPNGSIGEKQFEYNRRIIDATAEFAAFYKPNICFYAQYGNESLEALRRTISYIHDQHPRKLAILDYKRADIGPSDNAYALEGFQIYSADAVTVNPYFGQGALAPHLKWENKGVIILCRTSNPGGDEFQDQLTLVSAAGTVLRASELQTEDIQHYATNGYRLTRMYKVVAAQIANEWNTRGNCGLVMGATYAKQVDEIRDIVNDMFLLLPGFGKQGAMVRDVTPFSSKKNGRYANNSSSGIIFAYQKPLYRNAGIGFEQAAHEEAKQLHLEDHAARAA